MTFKIDIQDLEKELKTLEKKAYPFASRAALDTLAFRAREYAQETIGRKMIERNQFTRRRVLVNRVGSSLNVDLQQSEVGHTESYMETQEEGGIERKTGKHGVAIPTSASAGQGTAQPRTRLVRRSNKMQNINFRRRAFRSLGKTYKQRLAVAIRLAKRDGERFFYGEFSGRSKGIVRMMASRSSRRAKLRMMHSLSSRLVRIPRTRWLKPATDRALGDFEEIYRRALEFQLRRHGWR